MRPARSGCVGVLPISVSGGSRKNVQMRRYRRALMPRRRGRFEWNRQSFQPTVNATLMNVDLLGGFRTAAAISINLPEITIWRIKLRISIKFTLAAAMAAADGVLLTVFVDGQTQTPLTQISNPLDERDMLYALLFASETVMTGSSTTGAGTFIMYKEFDIKTHRRLRSLNDTLWLQLASSGQAQITDVSISQATLLRVGSN